MTLKLKIKITGPKVHEVGHIYFLMSNAIDIGLKGFHARNRTGGKEPEVIALSKAMKNQLRILRNW